MIHKILYKCFERYKNPSLDSYYKFLLESDFWSLEKLEEYQFLKCRDFLSFAYTYSDYYRDLFDECRFSPASMTSLQDLKNIPVLEKSTLLRLNGKIQSKYPFKKLFLSETSGSTGQPMRFYRNEEWVSQHRASIFRGHSWYGLERWDRNGLFWGYNLARNKRWKIRILDYFQNSYRFFSYKEEDLLHFIRHLGKASYLQGYSSMIYEVAKMVNRGEIKKDFYLKMVKGTSEKIYDSYKSEVNTAFGQKLISEYGAAEAGIIAFECPCGSMHINMESVIVEEENGEIIVTNLLSKSFPIIRYKLGDSVILADTKYKCPCGRQHPVLLDVVGRVGSVIYGREHKYPSLTLYYVFKNLLLKFNICLNYQGVQYQKGSLELRLEQSDTGYELVLRDELKKYFADDLDIRILYSQSIHTYKGKLRDFVSKVNIKE